MAQKNLNARISWRRDTSANWTSANPVLLNGEIIVVDTAEGEVRFKIGDGSKTYTQLPFEDEVIRNLINGKSSVLVSATQTTGVEVGKIAVDGTETVLYAPDGAKYTAGNGISINNNNEISTSVDFSTKANIASPTFTGTPKAPTATAGTNTTQIATTAFVKTAVDNLASGTKVSSAASADTATSASGLDSTGIAQVKTIKVDNAAVADSANKVSQGLTIGNKTYDGSSAMTVTPSDLGLNSALIFVGFTTTILTDGATTSPIIINNTNHAPAIGNVVIVSGTDQEFVWTGSLWEELGDASSCSIKGHTHTVTFKPAGTIDTPTFTGTSTNSNKPDTTNVTTIYSIDDIGTLPSLDFSSGSLPSALFESGSLPSADISDGSVSLSGTVSNKHLTIGINYTKQNLNFSAGTLPSLVFDSGALPSAAFSAGSLPSSSAVNVPNTNHIHTVTANGVISQPTFTGTEVTITTSGSSN